MSIATFKLAGDLEEAFNKVGASMMTTAFAAKLLAYVYVRGGGNEAVVYNEALNAGIAIAQRKMRILGGEVPDRRALATIPVYIRELEKKGDDTPWLKEIYERYRLRPR